MLRDIQQRCSFAGAQEMVGIPLQYTSCPAPRALLLHPERHEKLDLFV